MWLDVESLYLDHATSVLRFDVCDRQGDSSFLSIFRRVPPRVGYVVTGTLEFERVLAVMVEDTEKIRYYDINEVRYCEEEHEIRILTGCPVGIRIRVREFAARFRRDEG